MNCIKCGSPLPPVASFCMKCGQPVDQAPKNKSAAGSGQHISDTPHHFMPKPGMPSPTVPRSVIPQPGLPVSATSRPAMPKPDISSPVTVRPGIPQPRMSRPAIPTSGPVQPAKGTFTNAVESLDNALASGVPNGQHQQTRNVQYKIPDHRDIQIQMAAEQVRSERNTERATDRRSMEFVDGIEIVRGRAIWNIQPGEVARRIKESELEEIEKLKGIIVQEGCSALIFVNGEFVTSLSSGAYLFFKSEQEEQAALKQAIEDAEKQMAEDERMRLDAQRITQPTFRELGIVGEMGRAVNWIGRLIFGQKKKDDNVKKRQLDYARILARLTQAPIMSVYLVSNRHIPLTFGGSINTEGNVDFMPYTIPVGIHNVEIGVSLEVCVSDIQRLAVNYLSDRSHLTTTDIYNILSSTIETLLKSELRNASYETAGLGTEVTERLKERIRQAIDQRLHGLRCATVHSITDNNADFERFRNVERQLYNTEREIDFMQRTGEFRNRMEIEANNQQLISARNAEDLRHSMQKLNRDALLHDNELEEFVELMESQRRIRQATTAEEEQTALDTLKKSRLVKQDEIEELQDALAHKKIPREEITQLMRIQSQQKVDETRMKAEWALGDMITNHEWEREDLERRRNWGIEDEVREREWTFEQLEYDRAMGRRKSEDDYDFEQMMRHRHIEREDRMEARNWQIENENRQFERERITRDDEDRMEGNRHQRNIEKLQAMAQMQSLIDAQKYKHEENVASIHANEQMNRDNLFAGMSAEQIRAAQLSHLSEDAQLAMANSYSSEKEMETLRSASADKEAMMQEMLRMQQENTAAQMNAMMQMAGMIKDTAAGVSGAFQSAQQQRIDNLQAQHAHEQARNEHLQDIAINNLSKVSTAAASNINAFNGGIPNGPSPTRQTTVAEIIECQCYNCGHTIKIATGTPSCPDCGAPFQW